LFKSFLEAPLSEYHLLSFGASLSHERSTSSILFNAQDCQPLSPECENASPTLSRTKEVESNDLLHVFLKDSWFVNDKLSVFPGIALFANDSTNESFIEPRFALEYSAREDLILSFGAGLNHQSAEQIQLSELYGNPELESIESVQKVRLTGLKHLFEKRSESGLLAGYRSPWPMPRVKIIAMKKITHLLSVNRTTFL